MGEIEKFTLDTVDSVWQLVKESHYTQALVIIYSALDTLALASLSRGDVTRSNFLDWVNRYLRPDSELGCTAEDLYSARCALVHSGAAESRMSRGGQANELWYVTSPRSINLVEEHAQKINSNTKVIYFTDLISAFVAASERFNDEISSDRVSQQVVNERIRRWLRFVATSYLEESEK